MGQDEEAMELFRKGEEINQAAGFVHNYQVILANVGKVYLFCRDHLTAVRYYQRAVSMAGEIKDQF
jgi:tetratricopeptide (TPR) repeat protein